MKTTIALPQVQQQYKTNFDLWARHQPKLYEDDHIYIERSTGVGVTNLVEHPSKKLQAKKLGPYLVKKTWSNTRQLDEDGVGNVVSIDELPSATSRYGQATLGDNNDNTTDLTDDKMAKFNSTKASQDNTVKYVVNKIDDDDVVSGDKLYRVRWCGVNQRKIPLNQHTTSRTILPKLTGAVETVRDAHIEIYLGEIKN